MKKEKDSKEQEELRRDPIKLAEDIYWVGAWLEDDNFQCHTYLIKEGKDSVLIDPGSLITYPEVIKKIEKLIDPRDVKYFICHHQDPDITACISQYEKDYPREDRLIVTHWKTKTLLVHYNWKSKFYLVDEHNWRLELPSGRVLRFIFTPYAHFAGNICTYDVKSKILFSSDLFGGFVTKKKLFIEDKLFFEEDFFECIKKFHEYYIPSRIILQFALDRIKDLELHMIAPQHGYIIPKKYILSFIERLAELECGIFIYIEKGEWNFNAIARMNEWIRGLYIEVLEGRRGLKEFLNYICNRMLIFFALKSFLVIVTKGKTVFLWDGLKGKRKAFAVDRKTEMWIKKMNFLAKDKEFLKVKDEEVKKIHRELEPERNDVYLFKLSEECDGEKENRLENEFSSFLIVELEEEFGTKMNFDIRLFFEKLKRILKYCLDEELRELKLRKNQRRFYNYAIKDNLTGVYNRFYLNIKLEELEKEIRRYHIPLSIMMIDIDYFKRVNDAFGHYVGDEILRKMARLLRNSLRETDIVARYGGEEFTVLLPYTQLDKACKVAERIRKKIEETEFVVEEHKIKITVSIGVSEVDFEELEEKGIIKFIKEADKLLYKAKKEGRNRVVCKNKS